MYELIANTGMSFEPTTMLRSLNLFYTCSMACLLNAAEWLIDLTLRALLQPAILTYN